MSWLFIAIGAYFLTAVNSVVDKYLLHRTDPHPVAYAFYVGIFSIFTLVLTPFGFEWPGVSQALIALSVGAVFLCALIAFFTALKADEASRIVALVGGFTPIFILIFSDLLLGTVFSAREYYALALLIAGGVLISFRKSKTCGIFELHKYECVRSTEIAILSSVFFALFFVLAKFTFNGQEFVSGFVWTRIGSFLAALLLLFIPAARAHIFHTTKTAGAKVGALFVANKTLAGISFFLLNYAIFLGNIAIVNALEGVKYLFVLVMAYYFSTRMPHILREQVTPLIITQKVGAVALIFAGLFVLAMV